MDYIGKGDVFLKIFSNGKSIVELVFAISQACLFNSLIKVLLLVYVHVICTYCT